MSSTGLWDSRFLADEAVGTAEIADGALSADVAGRAKIATDFFNEATVDAKFAASAIDTDRLKEGAELFKRDGSVVATGAFDLGGFKISNLAAPTLAGDATSKNYVDQAVTAGKAWREAVLVPEQLLNGDGTGGVLQAILAAVVTNPTAGDTFVITDGTTTETFTFEAVEDAAFEVLIGASAADTLVNLIQAINDDSTLWSAISSSSLDEYFAGEPATQAVIYRTAVSAAADRVYGTLTVTTGIKVVEFATGDQDYRKASGTESDLPAADPAAKRFGFGRAHANLASAETHLTVDNNETYTWSDDLDVWSQSDIGAIGAGAGLTKTSNTLDVGDVDKGVQVNADDVQIDASEIASDGLAQVAGGGNEHLLAVKADSTTGGDTAPVTVGANGVGVDVTTLDGDHLDVDFTPSNYTPDAAPAEAADVDDLAAHLKGIDTALGTSSFTRVSNEEVTAENLTTDTALTDELDNTPIAASLSLFLNGMKITEGVYWTRSGTTITWLGTVFELKSTDDLRAHYDHA